MNMILPSTTYNSPLIGHTLLLRVKTRLPGFVLAFPLLGRSLTHFQILSTRDLSVLKTYVADTPLNTAAITSKKDFVILGGGQAAMDVTTTSARQGKFEARFYHKIFEDEIGRVRGHFGPLNTIAVHPQGTAYASGGEDGYVRMHVFDKSYFDFMYEVEREQARK